MASLAAKGPCEEQSREHQIRVKGRADDSVRLVMPGDRPLASSTWPRRNQPGRNGQHTAGWPTRQNAQLQRNTQDRITNRDWRQIGGYECVWPGAS